MTPALRERQPGWPRAFAATARSDGSSADVGRTSQKGSSPGGSTRRKACGVTALANRLNYLPLARNDLERLGDIVAQLSIVGA